MFKKHYNQNKSMLSSLSIDILLCFVHVNAKCFTFKSSHSHGNSNKGSTQVVL